MAGKFGKLLKCNQVENLLSIRNSKRLFGNEDKRKSFS